MPPVPDTAYVHHYRGRCIDKFLHADCDVMLRRSYVDSVYMDADVPRYSVRMWACVAASVARYAYGRYSGVCGCGVWCVGKGWCGGVSWYRGVWRMWLKGWCGGVCMGVGCVVVCGGRFEAVGVSE